MPAEPQRERLQKVLAHAGVASRRKCEAYIAAGRVTVNGRVVTELGTKVDPQRDEIAFDGKPVQSAGAGLRYYALYKPPGHVSTVSDPEGRPTARGLVPTDERLYPVGRLDLDSEGLMLFTNDGELAHRLMHPRYEHSKEYVVLVRGRPGPETLRRLHEGVAIGEDGFLAQAEAQTLPVNWRWRGQRAPRGGAWLRLTLHQGHKRQIRYMLEAVGHSVQRLIRIRIDRLTLDDLQPGEGRWLKDDESVALRRSAGLFQRRAPSGQARRSS